MVDAIVWTEGKTDAQHMRRACDVLGFKYRIDLPVSSDMGDDALLKQCQALSKAPQATPTIFIFDHDNPDLVSKVIILTQSIDVLFAGKDDFFAEIEADSDKFVVHLTTYLDSSAYKEEVYRDYADLSGDKLDTVEVALSQGEGARWVDIARLEKIRVSSGNDPQVLRLLVMYNIAIEPPGFDEAYIFAKELEKYPLNGEDIVMDLAQFYTEWATTLKLRIELDPIKEMLRKQKYKELSDHAISLLHKGAIEPSHRRSHLLAQCMFNKWDYGAAINYIDDAIRSLPPNSYLADSYEKLRQEIRKKARYYQGRP